MWKGETFHLELSHYWLYAEAFKRSHSPDSPDTSYCSTHCCSPRISPCQGLLPSPSTCNLQK
ncbi:7100_t:CDS:2 [Ambispora gerdemannii]|uniref:7100_t:CDS:1 n=1 Tax=Ambispora gerdemannii TaxID=144530 RepID=A0A9N9F9I3_9GLOM|nr:7100_t:CDS:2 [Ambispora gerdemannii]